MGGSALDCSGRRLTLRVTVTVWTLPEAAQTTSSRTLSADLNRRLAKSIDTSLGSCGISCCSPEPAASAKFQRAAYYPLWSMGWPVCSILGIRNGGVASR